MISLNRIRILVCILLSFTGIYITKVGFAKLTLFHAIAPLAGFLFFFKGMRYDTWKAAAPTYFWLFFFYIVGVNIWLFEEIKVSSFAYSIIVLLEMMLLYNIVKKIDRATIKKILRIIIGLYFVNLLITTFLIIFNIQLGYPFSSVFQIYNYSQRIRPYGFSDEPSYAAIILVFSFYVYLSMDRFRYNKSEAWWYLITVISILLTRSSYGYMMLALVLLLFLTRSNFILIQINTLVREKVFTLDQILKGVVITIAALVVLFQTSDVELGVAVERIGNVISSIAGTDGTVAERIKSLEKVDGSAGMRIIPTLHLIDYFGRTDPEYMWFGRGAGQATYFFSQFYGNHVTLLGFIPAFVYNYGIVGTLIFFLMLRKMMPRGRWLLFLLAVLFMFNADINTQIFLYVLFCVMLAKKIANTHEPVQGNA